MGFMALPRIRLVVAVLTALAAGTAAGCVHPAATPNAVTTLTCRATAGQQGADPHALRVNGVESFALRGDSNPADPLPISAGSRAPLPDLEDLPCRGRHRPSLPARGRHQSSVGEAVLRVPD